MNKAEFKAISMICQKLDWNTRPVIEVCESIKQMVRNQQSLEIDTIGECDDEEDTLLSIALWDSAKIFSTLLVSDYQSLCDYHQNYKGLLFLEDMGLGSNADVGIMIAYAEQSAELLAAEYEEEDYEFDMLTSFKETQLSCRY